MLLIVCMVSFILTVPFALTAEELPAYQYGKYATGRTVPLFGDSVNVRAKPSTGAPVVVRLPVGHPVIVTQATGDSLTVNKYVETWYAVRGSDPATGKTFIGHVWGGLLAKAWARADFDGDGADELIAAGIIACSNERKIMEARIVKNGAVISSVRFEAIETLMGVEPCRYGYTLHGAYLGSKGFTPDIKFFRIGFEYGACDYANGDVILYWDGRNIRYALTALSMGNELGSHSFAYVFPGMKGGMKNALIVDYTSVFRDEETAKTKSTALRREIFRWDGKELKKRGND